MLAIVITSYGTSEPAARLARRLTEENAEILVVVAHDDASQPLDRGCFEGLDDVVLLPGRYHVRWGDFSFAAELLHVMERLRDVTFDWLLLWSAQDWPLRPLGDLERELADVDAVMQCTDSCPQARRYYHRSYELRGRTGSFVSGRRRRACVGMSAWLPLISLYFPPHAQPPRLDVPALRHPFRHGSRAYFGSNWFALRKAAMLRLLETAAADPALVRHFSRTFVPSEGFFQTVIGNDAAIRLRNGTLHFERWQGDSPHPAVLGIHDIPELLASNCWWARKFPRDADAVVRQLDEARAASRLEDVRVEQFSSQAPRRHGVV